MLTKRKFPLGIFLVSIFVGVVGWVKAEDTKILVESVLDDHMGKSVVTSGQIVMVGVPDDDSAAGKDAGAIFVFSREEVGWVEKAKIIPEDLNPDDEFGKAIALSGDTLVVGMPRYSKISNDHGTVFVYTRSGDKWIRQPNVNAYDTEENDRFGNAVDFDGKSLIVGAYSANAPKGDSGAAYVFARQRNGWTQQAKLVADDGDSFDWFGSSVAISGNLAVVGAIREDGKGVNSDSGAVYVFRRSGGSWKQEAKVIGLSTREKHNFGHTVKTNGEIFAVGVPKGGAAGNGAVYFFHYADNIWRQSGAALTTRSGNNFGESIALQNRTIIVGSPGDDNSVIDEDDERGSTGAAYIYRKRGDRWQLIEKLLPHDAIEGDDLGYAVALDGDTAVVGSPDNSAGGPESGAAYIYTKQGEKWVKQVKLIDIVSSSEDQFGYSVAITDKMAVVGSRQDDRRGINTGSVYVYTSLTDDKGETRWDKQSVLTADDAAIGAQFGHAVAVDKNTILVGAHGMDDAGIDSGAAYLFAKTSDVWNQQAKITGQGTGDLFGYSLAIDGDMVVVGAHGANQEAGAAFVFVRDNATWRQQAKLEANDSTPGDAFGYSVAIHQQTVIVGAPKNDIVGTNAGAAYVFVKQGDQWVQQAKLIAADAAIGDQFGIAVATEKDTAIIGAWLDDIAEPEIGAALDAGSAYAFVRQKGNWSQQTKFIADEPGVEAHFGLSVALNDLAVVVGAPDHSLIEDKDEPPIPSTGSVYSFARVGEFWSPAILATISEGEKPYDRFGGTLGISGEKIIIGIHGDDDAGNDAGAVFIFDYVDFGLEVEPEPFSVQPDSGLKISSHAKVKTGEFGGQPRQTELLSNYPNPFNPETWIPFQLAQPASVVLRLYDFEGKIIRTIDLGYKKTGFYTATNRAIYWDGKNQLGESVSSGVYFYRLTTSDYDAMKKMVILK